ncbi:MAG: hypothetical protein WBO70_08650 [Erysipelotrichaceae bacterium]
MDNIWIYIIVAGLFILETLIQRVLSKRFVEDLAYLLYEKGDAKAYLEKLDSFSGKFFIGKKKRKFMSIDGYLLLDDKAKIDEIFDELENTNLSYAAQVGLLQKQIQYWVKNKQCERANKANDLLQVMGAKINDPQMKLMAEECNALVQINCNNNGDLVKEMIAKGDASTSDFGKAIYYYRAAKCYYFKKDKAMMDKYLKEAQLKAAGTPLLKHIELCIKDNSMFLEQ